MAFDHDDTDRLYDKTILPILKANGILPVIINRREDNRDINNQIIEQLEACDFCITDLTYARPSVYFEAGYAQSKVEVIYTVRSDHLLKNQPDDQRVHFDLKMKPLIKWNTPQDRAFRKKLERRIKSTFLRNWNRIQKSEKRQKRWEDDFARMPLLRRLTTLRRCALDKIGKLGFLEWTPLETEPLVLGLSFAYRQIVSRLGVIPWVMTQRRDKRMLHVVSFWVEESLTLTKLRDKFEYRFISSSHPPHLKFHKMAEERSPVNRTVEHHVLCSIRPVPRSRIMSALPRLSWDSANLRYTTAIDWDCQEERWKNKGKGIDWIKVKLTGSRTLYVHFIDGIRSLPQFEERVGSISEQIQMSIGLRHGTRIKAKNTK